MKYGTAAGVAKAKAEEEIKGQTDAQKRHYTKASLLTALWRVYGILLEYCYHSNYKVQICEILNENR